MIRTLFLFHIIRDLLLSQTIMATRLGLRGVLKGLHLLLAHGAEDSDLDYVWFIILGTFYNDHPIIQHYRYPKHAAPVLITLG